VKPTCSFQHQGQDKKSTWWESSDCFQHEMTSAYTPCNTLKWWFNANPPEQIMNKHIWCLYLPKSHINTIVRLILHLNSGELKGIGLPLQYFTRHIKLSDCSSNPMSTFTANITTAQILYSIRTMHPIESIQIKMSVYQGMWSHRSCPCQNIALHSVKKQTVSFKNGSENYEGDTIPLLSLHEAYLLAHS
jgi:hypothetical protein